MSDWSITPELRTWLFKRLSAGSVVVELGSGDGTGKLAEKLKVYSVEHDKKWLQKANNLISIFAPLKQYDGYQWYDVDVLKRELPKQYDCLLVDGPPGRIGRIGLWHQRDLIVINILLIFDDCDRPAEFKLWWKFLRQRKQPGYLKWFGEKCGGIIDPTATVSTVLIAWFQFFLFPRTYSVLLKFLKKRARKI